MSSLSSQSMAERPERSRNAKAQARHRAKRKAYIEQLETTVTKLQTALGFTPDQVAALPPPLVKIRELEQENMRLLRENEEMRRMLASDPTRSQLSDYSRRNSLSAFHDPRDCDRDFKKRKVSLNEDDVYMSPGGTPPHPNDVLTRPPPLTIPQPTSHHYNGVPTSNHNGAGSAAMYNLHAPAFQLPHTPSGSSSTSSPPFSPAQMQPNSHSPVNHRPPPLSNHMSNYSHHANQYGSVKTEDDNYASSNHHHSSQNGQYPHTLPSFAHTVPHNEMENWHAYSTERAQLHR